MSTPLASAPQFAEQLAARLSRVVPDGFTVTAEDSYVTVAQHGEEVGGTGAAEFLESIDGLHEPEATLERAARVVLDAVQDYVVDSTGQPWPGTDSQPVANAKLTDGQLDMWFGNRDNPTLLLDPLGPFQHS